MLFHYFEIYFTKSVKLSHKLITHWLLVDKTTFYCDFPSFFFSQKKQQNSQHFLISFCLCHNGSWSKLPLSPRLMIIKSALHDTTSSKQSQTESEFGWQKRYRYADHNWGQRTRSKLSTGTVGRTHYCFFRALNSFPPPPQKKRNETKQNKALALYLFVCCFYQPIYVPNQRVKVLQNEQSEIAKLP